MRLARLSFFILALFLSTSIDGQDILPPIIQWDGKSTELIVENDHPWVTKAEQSGFERTSTYTETHQYLKKLCDSSPLLQMNVIGTSPNGLEIHLIVATREGIHTPEAIRSSSKPAFLAQAGIHAGEIDGKDAGMMLLRDIAHGGKSALLDDVNFLFIPILSVDGHERASSYNRPNQRGPENMGWRTNAQNLNLNRDYMKLDTRELRAAIKVINEYQPDLYMDIHVTDGADYQYDITYGFIGPHGYSPAISTWLRDQFKPAINQGLSAKGHIPGPLMFSIGGGDFSKGNIDYAFGPVFSHAYGDLRHLPTILVENHSLKPYRQRVLGTYVLLEETLRFLPKERDRLQKVIQEDVNRQKEKLPIAFEVPQFAQNQTDKNPDMNSSGPISLPDSMLLLGIESIAAKSDISKGSYLKWTGKPIQKTIPFYVSDQVSKWVERPQKYYVPPTYPDVIQRLEWHGIEMEFLTQPEEREVTMYRIQDAELQRRPFEGRVKVSGTPHPEIHVTQFPKGTAVIKTDQPLGDLAILLLEPDANDSFYKWGFFLSILQRTEYMESYAVEPLMSDMLLRSQAFVDTYLEKMQSDSSFASNPRAIRNWFYKQSPYHDKNYMLYPVGIFK